MKTSIAIKLENVTVEVQDKLLVEEIHLELRDGERVALLGPSGAGKTTILRVLAGFEDRIRSGRVEINGMAAFEKGRTRLLPHQRQTSMLFQDLALWPHLTVNEHLRFPLRKLGLKRAEWKGKIQEILEVMGIPHRGPARPAELSGGEQQRLALARALIARPKVLLLDEPFSSLDLPLKKEMMELVLASHERFSFTLVHVTHDPVEAVGLADRIVLIESGKIAWSGKPYKIKGSKHPASEALFVALEWFNETVRSSSNASQ